MAAERDSKRRNNPLISKIYPVMNFRMYPQIYPQIFSLGIGIRSRVRLCAWAHYSRFARAWEIRCGVRDFAFFAIPRHTMRPSRRIWTNMGVFLGGDCMAATWCATAPGSHLICLALGDHAFATHPLLNKIAFSFNKVDRY